MGTWTLWVMKELGTRNQNARGLWALIPQEFGIWTLEGTEAGVSATTTSYVPRIILVSRIPKPIHFTFSRRSPLLALFT